MSEQSNYWSSNHDYIERNSKFNHELGVKAWTQILDNRLDHINSVIDCGANIGRNISFLKDSRLVPNAEFYALDINQDALKKLNSVFPDVQTQNVNLLDFSVEKTFDLVFTSGVLIHVDPKNLHSVFGNLMKVTKKYLLMIEYFNRTLIEIPYHGKERLLWKMDFGKEFIQFSGWNVVDYGFLWGHEYDACGFDDCNYWIFERR